MRSISSTLAEASRLAPVSTPAVKVEITNRVWGIMNLRWETLYEGTEPDYFHGATIPGDGSLLRIRIEPNADPTLRKIWFQRVTSPAPGSDFSIWTEFDPGNWGFDAKITSFNNTVNAFHIGGDAALNPRIIYERISTDAGATWGAWASIYTHTSDIAHLATCYKGNGDMLLLFADTAGTVYSMKKPAGGTWTSPTAWTNSLSKVNGLSVFHSGDWNVAITGDDPAGEKGIWTCLLGDGYSAAVDTWTSLAPIIIRGATEPYEYHAPSASDPDVFRIFFMEKFTLTEAQNRLYWSYSPATAEWISNLWREPVPFNLQRSYGLAMTYHDAYVWLTCPDRVYRAPLSFTSWDISDDVIEIKKSAKGWLYRESDTIILNNTDGKYNAFDKMGHEVLISWGYYTAAGVEYSAGPGYWITSWEHSSYFGVRGLARARDYPFPTLTIKCSTGWDILSRWRARLEYSWAAGEKNIFKLLTWIFARVGLELSAFSNSDSMVNFYPAFTIKKGSRGRTAVKKLLSWVRDKLLFRGHYGYIVDLLTTDAVDVTYHSTYDKAQYIYKGKYLSYSPDPNIAEVWDTDLMVERYDWDSIKDVYDRRKVITEPAYPSTTPMIQRAEDEIRMGTYFAPTTNWLIATLHPGLELYDVIEITDEGANVSAMKKRVIGLDCHYRKLKNLYTQKIYLGDL